LRNEYLLQFEIEIYVLDLDLLLKIQSLQ